VNAVAAQVLPARDSLADYFEQAGIHSYAPWAHDVILSKVPRTYQVGDLNLLAACLPRAALWSDPGVGKTISVQALVLWLVGEGNKAVCIMPPTLVKQFRESFHETFRNLPVRVEICYGTPAQRQKQIDGWERDGWPEVLIMGYEVFKGERQIRDVIHVRDADGNPAYTKTGKPKTRTRRTQLPMYKTGDPANVATFGYGLLLDKGYNMLVVDEAINTKQPSTILYEAIWCFVRPDKKDESNGLILMDGSPARTNADDVYGLLSLLDPTWYGSQREFDSMHCVLDMFSARRLVIEYKNLDLLHARLFARARRVTKREAYADGSMPPRQVIELRVDLSDAHREVYRQITEDRLIELPDDAIIPIENASALREASHQCLMNPEKFGSDGKDNALVEQIEQIVQSLGGQKVILYLWYRDSVEKMREHFKALNPATLYGGVTGNARERERKKFIEDPTCRMLIANMRSGGVGVDGLQTVCSYGIIAEGITSPGGLEQVIGRLERRGQTETITIYFLTVRGTISVYLRNQLLKKEAVNNEVVRDRKALLRELIGADGLIGSLDETGD
jgi:SNF2 family DNA or RNA helicase